MDINCYKQDIEKAIECTFQVAGIHFLKLIRISNVCEQLNIEEDDVFSDFKLFILEKQGKPIYSFREDSGAKYTTYITVVFRNWLYRKLQGAKKLKNEIGGDDISSSIKDGRSTGEEDFLKTETDSILIESLNHCIDSLSESSQNLLEEIMDKGKSISDIAKEGNLKADKLYNQYYAILKTLKKCLDSKGIKGEMVKNHE